MLNSSIAEKPSMLAGAADDIIIGGTGTIASLDGGAGNDEITGNGPSDTIHGGTGDDLIQVFLPTSLHSSPTIFGDGGTDILSVTATNNPDTIPVKPTGGGVALDSGSTASLL